MLPPLTSPLDPSLSIMQSITDQQEKAAREAEDRRQGRTETPTVAVPTGGRTETPRALSDFFFSYGLTVTSAMAKLMDRVVSYLNDKLAVGRDGDRAAVAAGNAWRDDALLGAVDVNSEEDFSLGVPKEGAVSYQKAALTIQATFNMEALSRDRDLTRMLEEMIGFDLDGMTIADLVDAFADPNGKAAEKVKAVISEGLAGQTGSKAMQRLDDAAAGPLTAEETVARALETSPMDEVDEETKAEDLEDIRTARAFDVLASIGEMRNEIAAREEAETDGGTAGESRPEASSKGADDTAEPVADAAERFSLIVAAYRELFADETGEDEAERAPPASIYT